jgi:Ca-activated chloride channel homolog
LNQVLLTQIATAANGFYLPMTGSTTVDVLYQRGLAPLPKTESTTKLVRQYHERFQWPLGLAIILLLVEVFLPDRKRVPRTEAIVTASNPELRKIVAALAVISLAGTAWASPAKAMRDYQAGHFKDAYQEYLRSLERKPDDPRLQYNAGTAAYRAKQFEEAVKHFSAAATAPDLHLQEQAYYNLGNSLYRAGEDDPNPEKKNQIWEQSIKQFDTALKLDPKDADAQFNRDYVKKKLEELKQQQQQQKDQNKDKEKKDDKDQKQDQDKQDKQDKNQQQDQKKDDKDQKKDESKQNQKDSEKKPQPEDKKDQNKDQPAPSQKDKAKDKDKDQASPQSADKSKQNGETNGTENAASAQLGQMTPEEAKQLLDSQKDNEKVMIFIPPDQAKTHRRVFKDW